MEFFAYSCVCVSAECVSLRESVMLILFAVVQQPPDKFRVRPPRGILTFSLRTSLLVGYAAYFSCCLVWPLCGAVWNLALGVIVSDRLRHSLCAQTQSNRVSGVLEHRGSPATVNFKIQLKVGILRVGVGMSEGRRR